MSITLDKRTNKKNVLQYPLSIRFTIDRKRYYYHVGGNYTEEEFSEICNVQRSRSGKYEIKKQWQELLDHYGSILKKLGNGRDLSLDMIRGAVTGTSVNPDETFISVWKRVIAEQKASGHYSSGERSESVLNSFLMFVGDSFKGFNVDKAVLAKWVDGMTNGKEVNGKIVGKLNETTQGINLRTCRAIWNRCQELGFMENMEYPFSNKTAKGLIAIPRGNTRKASYFDVDKMTELYHVFMEKRYPESWDAYTARNVHRSLGLFLAQYLCNGFNLADAAALTYDDYYYSTRKRAFRFYRQKTAGRSENGAEVMIPIITPLKNILDEIAAEPARGGLVFPNILKGATTDEECRKRTRQENKNIRMRMHKLCQTLGWEEEPSGTWARHSFATNMRNAGVEIDYITESMGHSMGKNVTSIYLASYPLDKQFEYNSRLLNTNPPSADVDLDSMSKDELKAMLLRMMAKGDK